MYLIDKSNQVLSRWLFRPGGQYNAAITRMFIALALWLTITHGGLDYAPIYNHWLTLRIDFGWFPKGIIKFADLIFHGPPPEWLVKSIYYTAHISLWCMFVGLFVPFTQILAVLTVLFIVSLHTSFEPYWSHGFNVQLLAGLAFMFARSSDVLSFDSLIRKWRGKKSSIQWKQIYWWPVIFSELAVALFMFGAFLQKFRNGGIFWALSDNIRNSLIMSWFQYRSDPTDTSLFLMSDPLIWKTAGTLQLFAQSTTILAAFLLSRPIFRLIFGGIFFFVEIIALSLVFRFWHPFWVPLCFIAVDWEYFYAQFKELRKKVKSSILNKENFLALFAHRTSIQAKLTKEKFLEPSRKYARCVIIFGSLFFGYYAATLVFVLGEKHLNYPFSSMAFFSGTSALKPYNKHNYFPIYTGRIDIYRQEDGNKPLPIYYRLVDNLLVGASTIQDLKKVDVAMHKQLKEGIYISASKEGQTPISAAIQPQKIVYRSGVGATTPYPLKPGIVELHMGYRAVRDERGFRALVANLEWDGQENRYVIDIEHIGFKKPKFEVLARFNVLENPQFTQPLSLPGYWRDDRFFIEHSISNKNKIFTLIKIVDPELKIDEIYYGPENFMTKIEDFLLYDSNKKFPLDQKDVRFKRFEEAGFYINWLDAKRNPHLTLELKNKGLDVNKGIVLSYYGEKYFGDQALQMIALMSTPSNLFNRISKKIFQNKRLAHYLYPVLKESRGLILRYLGKNPHEL